MILLAALLLVAEPAPLAVDTDPLELSISDDVGLEWDCERERGSDKLQLAEVAGPDGKRPLFTRTLGAQSPKVVVDCGAEVITYAESSLSMSSGFCPHEWGLEIHLIDGSRDRAVADLRLGQAWIEGYECLRRNR